MHRNLLRALAAILLLHLIALGINIVSDQAEAWIAEHVGDKYLIVVIAMLVLSIILLWAIGDNDSQKVEKVKANPPTPAEAKDSEPHIPPPPSLEGPTLAQYRAIKTELKQGQLARALKLMEAIGVYKEAALRMQMQLADYERSKLVGDSSEEQLRVWKNQIEDKIITQLTPHEPSEQIPEAESSAESRLSLARAIHDEADGYLQASRNFLGRDDELAQLADLIEDPGVLGVLVAGLAGAGKTDICRVAMQAYLRRAPQRVVYWVEVEFNESRESLLHALGQLVKLAPEQVSEATVLAALAELPAGLVYLDNLETVLEDGSVLPLLERLLRLNNLRWLASSRSEIGGDAWRTFRLSGLADDAAVRLFRKEWANHGLEALPEELPQEVSQFVNRDLGNHPLSIVLTASHAVDYNSIEEVMRSWKTDGIRLLQRYAGKTDDRLDNWMYSLALSLSRIAAYPGACRLWCLCMLFQDGLDADSQGRLMQQGAFSPEDRAQLFKRNLIQRQKGRLYVLPPVAQFIRAVLQRGDGPLIEQDLFDATLHFVLDESVAPAFKLDVMEYFAAKADNYPDIVKLDDALFNDYIKTPFRSQAILPQLLSTAIYKEKEKLSADALLVMGQLAFLLGGNDEARKHYQRADELCQRTGYELGQANVQRNLGELAFRLGRNDEARQHYQRADDLYQRIGFELGQAHTAHCMALLQLREEDYRSAYENWTKALVKYQTVQSPYDIAETHLHLASLCAVLGYDMEQRQAHLAGAASLIEEFQFADLREGYQEIIDGLGDKEEEAR